MICWARTAFVFLGAASLLAPMSARNALAQVADTLPRASTPARDSGNAADQPQREALLPPALGPMDVWVTSVPHGLTLHFAPEPEPDRARDPHWIQIWPAKGVKTADPNSGWGNSPSPFEAPDARSEAGALLVRDVKPGRYIVGVGPLRLEGMQDESLALRGLVSPVPARGLGGRTRATEGILAYSVEKKPDAPLRVVVLAFDSSAALRESATQVDVEGVEKLYPSADRYDVDPTDVQRQLAGIFSQPAIDKAVELLRRGGKLRMVRGDVKIVAEVEPGGKLRRQQWINPPKGK